jgi:hypothetical protein
MNNFPPGSTVCRRGVVGSVAAVRSAASGAVVDAISDGMLVNSEFVVSQKTGGVGTYIDYHYTSTDVAPAGSIQFYLEDQPYRWDGSVVLV